MRIEKVRSKKLRREFQIPGIQYLISSIQYPLSSIHSHHLTSHPTMNTSSSGLKILASLFLLLFPFCLQAQPSNPWTHNQLIEPATLAAMLKQPEAKRPLILDIGPAGVIRGAKEIGPAHEKEGMAKLQQELSAVPKDRVVVIYCGCCPFEKCPNIRPAFAKLKSLGYKNARLLDLSHNLKKDWIDKGYPVTQ